VRKIGLLLDTLAAVTVFYFALPGDETVLTHEVSLGSSDIRTDGAVVVIDRTGQSEEMAEMLGRGSVAIFGRPFNERIAGRQ